MVKEAIEVYRKENFHHLLADVEDTEDTEDTATRSSRRAVFPRPEEGTRFAGYLYFRRCLIPVLMINHNNTDY
jgi:hypothetical protein